MSKMKNIAILYICTGKYDIFWEDFYKTSEKYFLNNSEKHYFVFTDAQSIYDENCDRVHKIYQKTLGWPYNTLMRFNMFKGIEEKLKEFDYIFFLNANMLFVDYVGEEILPKEEGLLVAKHPAFYDKDVDEYPYDRNEKSLAYIPYGQGDVYVQGAFNGGKSRDFLQLINELDKNINIDLDNDVIALWHDESQLNRYIVNKPGVRILEPMYCYPCGMEVSYPKKIYAVSKQAKFDVKSFKGQYAKRQSSVRKSLGVLKRKLLLKERFMYLIDVILGAHIEEISDEE